MNKNLAITSQPINELLASRWSPRAFDIEKPVSREQILSICEAGRWAPSCFGDEPWRFMVWDINSNKKDYLRAFDCIGEWNQRWIRTAPVLMASFADQNFRKNQKPNRHAQHDSGLATENILLQAFALGMVAHPIAGFDGDKLKKEFGIPDNFTSLAMIAIGYQADKNVLDEDHRDVEDKPRFRRPLGETFFDSKWEKSIDS